jgi:hypothetical protein
MSAGRRRAYAAVMAGIIVRPRPNPRPIIAAPMVV